MTFAARCGFVGVDLRGHQHRLVAERARVEDRRDLADDALVEQPLDARHHLVLGQPGEAGDMRERPLGEREAALHQVEQLLVRLVERDRSAVAARADLQRQPSGDVLRVVGDHDVGAGAADAGERLEHGGALVEQSLGGRRLDHRVLAADVVGGDREVGARRARGG